MFVSSAQRAVSPTVTHGGEPVLQNTSYGSGIAGENPSSVARAGYLI